MQGIDPGVIPVCFVTHLLPCAGVCQVALGQDLRADQHLQISHAAAAVHAICDVATIEHLRASAAWAECSQCRKGLCSSSSSGGACLPWKRRKSSRRQTAHVLGWPVPCKRATHCTLSQPNWWRLRHTHTSNWPAQLFCEVQATDHLRVHMCINLDTCATNGTVDSESIGADVGYTCGAYNCHW
eukprot:1158640-Pelagomonas_calceolata.AAC.5